MIALFWPTNNLCCMKESTLVFVTKNEKFAIDGLIFFLYEIDTEWK